MERMTYPAGLAYQPRRAYRSTDEKLLAGVAAGLAAHLSVPVNYVRLFFLVSSAFSGLGIILYGGLWLYLPLDTHQQDEAAPGIEAATRQGKRPGRVPRIRASARRTRAPRRTTTSARWRRSASGGASWRARCATRATSMPGTS